MYKQTVLHNFVTSECERYEQLHRQLSTSAPFLLDGSLTYRNDTYYRFIRENGKQYSVPLHDDALIDEMRESRYMRKCLPILERKINTCNEFLRKDVLYDPKQIEGELPSQYRLQNDLGLFLPADIDPDMWSKANYAKNPMTIDHPIFTSGGLKVRSKSESIIATRLEECNIPFRYEPLLRIGNEDFYPDFLILIPQLRKLIYWEHFGRMDDPDYANKTIYKIKKYSQAKICTGINLFITYESLHKPFGFREANQTLNEILNCQDLISW